MGNYYEPAQNRTANEALMLHPNFRLPEAPTIRLKSDRDFEKLVNYIVDAVAHFVSPPKIPGEDVKISCDDTANEIRTNLREKILKKLMEARG